MIVALHRPRVRTKEAKDPDRREAHARNESHARKVDRNRTLAHGLKVMVRAQNGAGGTAVGAGVRVRVRTGQLQAVMLRHQNHQRPRYADHSMVSVFSTLVRVY